MGHLTPLPDLVPDSNRNRNNQSVSQSISYLLTTVDSRLKQHNVTRVTRASETTHLQRTRMVFNSRRGHLKTQHEYPWRLGDPLGELTPLPRSGSRPSPKAPPRPLSVSTSGFQLQPLGPKQLRASKLLLNQGPSEPCYATDSLQR